MSQLFDALKRGRGASPSPEHVERTARADAVLATLGYRKQPRVTPAQRALLFAVGGLAVALGIAWALWPRETPRLRQTIAAGRQPAATAPPRTAVPESVLPATTPPEPAAPPALPQAPPAAAPARSARTPAPLESVVAVPSAPRPAPSGRTASSATAAVPPTSA